MIRDSVCSMAINPQNATVKTQYKGQTYYFCSKLYKTMFEREPEKYVKSEETKSEQVAP